MEKSNYLEDFISVEFFMNELKMPIRGSTTVRSVYSNLKSYTSAFNFEVINLPIKEPFSDGIESKYAVSKSFLELLKNEYISLDMVKEDISYTILNKITRKYKPELIKLQQTVRTGMFINVEELNSIPEYINIVKMKDLSTNPEYVTRKEVCEALGISLVTLNTVIRDYNIDYEKVSGQIYFKKETLNYLIEQQGEARKLLEEYYLASEAREIANITSIINLTDSETKVERIPCPSILPIPSAADKSGYLWKKVDIQAYLEDKSKRESVQIELETPYETFLYRLSYYNLSLDRFRVTKDLWLQYIKERLAFSKAKDATKYRYIGHLLETTKTLFTFLPEEIYKMSSPEINLSLLNNNIEITHRFRLFTFLKQIEIAFKEQGKAVKFTVRTLNNPFKDYAPLPEASDLYSIDEYQKIFTFAQDTMLHKERAIADTVNFLKTGNTKSYCSVWLYVLILLSNNWRHSTVTTEIPRINLSRTNANSLEWLRQNDLTITEAKDIVYQVGRSIIKVNKTGAESFFNIPDKLTIPFATAAAICELRLQARGAVDGPLIYIPSDKTINSRVEGAFFSSFPDDRFRFENRKMNRSLTTFIWSIVNHFSNNKDVPILASQFSRSHYEDSSTNIYIKLNQKQIDNLSEQLFSRDQFGFVFKLFSDLLIGESKNKQDETIKIGNIQKEFGNIFKVEATAGFINNISERQVNLESLAKNYTREELQETYSLLLANLLPGKEKHYQCIKKECIYKELSCRDCPISIPNIYSLTDTLDRYVKQIENMLQFDEYPVGERMRQANQFFIMRKQIQEAREIFGRDIVNTFLPGGKDRLAKLQELMPSKSNVIPYITVNKEDN